MTETSSSLQRSQQIRQLEFPDILLATRNFDESLVIGNDDVGKVYRGPFRTHLAGPDYRGLQSRGCGIPSDGFSSRIDTDTRVSNDSETSYPWSQRCRHFDFAEIQLATRNFDESFVIGHGGFGKVYRGKVINGAIPAVVAIKRLDPMSGQGAAEFCAEVELLSKSRHWNLVSLLGYCNCRNELILVYEYMPNGTLEQHLHKLGTRLSWVQRLKICIGAARGLQYLHMGIGTKVGIIHRDVKSSNILLDENLAAKVSDFGLSKICPSNQSLAYVSTHVKGTFGYLDPEYFYTGRLTRKSDVYAFGVVLLEVLCRKRAVDSSLDEDQWNLARWVQESIKAGNLKKIIDSDIRGQISPKCLKLFVQIVESCLCSSPKQRPTIAKVVVGLVSILTLEEKNSHSLQFARKTIFGKVADIFAFNSKATTPAHGVPRLLSNNNSNNMFPEGFAICTIPCTNMKVFKFTDLETATGNFSPDRLLCEAGFGNAFLGWVDKNTFTPSSPGNGTAIVVKERISSSSQRCDQWLAEVTLSGRLAHPNIIRLLGYCDDKKHRYLLVYEHINSQNFGQFIHRGSRESLSWATRLRIMIGVARGLTYLHSLKLICRGIKSSGILLDQDFNVKLVDFESEKPEVAHGLTYLHSLKLMCPGIKSSEILLNQDFKVATGNFEPKIQDVSLTTMVGGALGFLDPYYCITGNWSVKSDIYGFGVLLLETLTGLQIIDDKRPNEQVNLIAWSSRFLGKERELNQIMDPRLEKNYSKKGAFECIALALECLAKSPNDRPTSKEVLEILEKMYASNM